MNSLQTNELFKSVQELIEKAQSTIVRNVNSTMVLTYLHIGRMIVEDEQNGKTFAAYGAETISQLSQHLTKHFGRGYSVDSLERMRSFFVVYGKYMDVSNSATALRNLSERLILSWSHYLQLLKIKDADERSFYELEATTNNWSVRELQRQVNSSLYERLALSRDKEAIRKLAQEGQLLEKSTDVLCKEDNKAVVEFTLPLNNDQIFSKEYKLYLPSKDELKKQLE